MRKKTGRKNLTFYVYCIQFVNFNAMEPSP